MSLRRVVLPEFSDILSEFSVCRVGNICPNVHGDISNQREGDRERRGSGNPEYAMALGG